MTTQPTVTGLGGIRNTIDRKLSRHQIQRAILLGQMPGVGRDSEGRHTIATDNLHEALKSRGAKKLVDAAAEAVDLVVASHPQKAGIHEAFRRGCSVGVTIRLPAFTSPNTADASVELRLVNPDGTLLDQEPIAVAHLKPRAGK